MSSGVVRPTTVGGTISVADSAALAAMDANGLPLGSVVWNIEVGALFQLTASERTEITIDPTDGYATAQWTFANATFTGFEDCTLLVSLAAPNEAFGGTYTIDTVDSATVVTVTPVPDGVTTAPIEGGVTLFDDALVTDSVVAVAGTVGARWVLFTAANSVHADTADLATAATGPANAATFYATLDASRDSIVTLVAPAATLSFTGLTGNTDGDYAFNGILLLTGSGSLNTVTLQPNGLATNQIGTIMAPGNSGVTEADVALFYLNNLTNTADSALYVSGTLTSKTGRARIMSSFTYGSQTASVQGMNFFGAWTDAATAITSLTFNSNLTTNFRAGSFMRLRKLGNLT